jgi:hypothetical protein
MADSPLADMRSAEPKAADPLGALPAGVAEPDTIPANLSLALEFAEARIPVIPVKVFPKASADGWNKKPLIDDWQDRATTDPDVFRGWWQQWPEAVPGIWCGHPLLNLVVIDTDRHPGGADGIASFARLVDAHGPLPEHPITATAGGGEHHFFCQPDGPLLGNRRGTLPVGIDVLGVGGFIVAPGSVRPDGQKWASRSQPLIEAFKAGSIPPLPSWLAEIIRSRPPKSPFRAAPGSPNKLPALPAQGFSDAEVGTRERSYARAALRGIADELTATQQGTRNNSLFRAALRMGTMVARGWISEPEVIQELLSASDLNGYTADDGIAQARATIESGMSAGVGRPRADLVTEEVGCQIRFLEGAPWYPLKRQKELRVLYRNRLGDDASKSEIDEATCAALDGDPCGWDKKATGKLIAFTFEEYKEFSRTGPFPSTIRPYDASEEQVQAYRKEFHRPGRAAAARRYRAERKAKRKHVSDLDDRGSAIYEILTSEPQSIAAIARQLKRCVAFRKPKGERLDGDSLRRAIQREIKKPPLKDKIKLSEIVHDHGQKMFLLARA